jgi:hypothetical protein
VVSKEAQRVRSLMAEAGVEMIPDEAEKLLFVHNELVRLSKFPLKTLKEMVNQDDIGSVRLYETLKKFKRLKRNDKIKKSD